MPVEDTLNLKNGLNYAQFLEAILRIAFIKAAENNKTYASTLEEIFGNPDLDIKKRCFKDSFLNQVYDSEDNDNVFREYESLLCALFEKRGQVKNNTYSELDKGTLIAILKESGIIKAPEKKKADAPAKEEKKNAKGGAKGGAKAESGAPEEKKDE